MKRLLDHDPVTGTSTYHDYDHNDKTTQIVEVQDISSILEHNKKLQNEERYKRAGIKEDWYHFASVPNSVLLKFRQEHHLDWRNKDDLKKIERLLNTSEYRYLRTVDRI